MFRYKPVTVVLGILLPLLSSLAGFGCSSPPLSVPVVYDRETSFDEKPRMVMIVSFDGLRPDAIAAAEAFHIQSLEEAGASAKVARTILPAITLVSHASMLSGVSPEKHRIDWNHYNSRKGTISVPTVFDLAKRANLTTAMVVGKEKFRHLARDGTVDRFVFEDGSPSAIAKAAIEAIEKLNPQLIFVHFPHPDLVGHKDGWMSSAQLRAIWRSDQALGAVLESLRAGGRQRSTTILVTADHGGEGRGHGPDTELSRRIPWIAAGPGVTTRGTLEKPVMTFDTAATAAKWLALPVPDEWDGKSVF
jgi:predicted AlkP superfamily pyrophosphatase or phosphodiesterase